MLEINVWVSFINLVTGVQYYQTENKIEIVCVEESFFLGARPILTGR